MGDALPIPTLASRGFLMRKLQRGSIGIFTGGLIIDAAAGTTPLVTDIEIVHTVSSGVCNASIIFNESTVGAINNLVRRHSTDYAVMGNDDAGSPVNHTGEWTTDSITGSAWEVACTSEDSGSWTNPYASVGVYSLFTNSDIEWRMNRPGAKSYTPGTSTVTATFRIREVADTGNFTEFEVIATSIQT